MRRYHWIIVGLVLLGTVFWVLSSCEKRQNMTQRKAPEVWTYLCNELPDQWWQGKMRIDCQPYVDGQGRQPQVVGGHTFGHIFFCQVDEMGVWDLYSCWNGADETRAMCKTGRWIQGRLEYICRLP